MASGANEQNRARVVGCFFERPPKGCLKGAAAGIMMGPTASRAVRLALSCALVASSHALAERPGALGEDAAALKKIVPTEDEVSAARELKRKLVESSSARIFVAVFVLEPPDDFCIKRRVGGSQWRVGGSFRWAGRGCRWAGGCGGGLYGG